MVSDPLLLEAEADQQVANDQLEQAKSLRWPTVRLVADQAIARRSKNSNSSSSTFNPGLEASWNIYSFGAIDKEIKKNEFNTEYFQHKYGESREELAYTIGDLYLTALNAKDAIQVLKGTLRRHKKILADLAVVVKYDRGRQSEFVQGQARKLLVEQQINDYKQLLETALSSLSKYTRKKVSIKDLNNPFKGMTESSIIKRYALKDPKENPSYQAQRAELDSQVLEYEAEKAKRYPSLNLVGTANQDDQQVMLRVSWDLFNRASNYTIQEKSSLAAAAKFRLERVSRDALEAARLALINMQRNRLQLKTLKSQIQANTKVVDFYLLQFKIARKSLLEVLNAEKELSDVKIAYANARNEFNRAALNYLRSQGKISAWVGVPANPGTQTLITQRPERTETSGEREMNNRAIMPLSEARSKALAAQGHQFQQSGHSSAPALSTQSDLMRQIGEVYPQGVGMQDSIDFDRFSF